jgi:hypothetical protein
MIKLFCKHIFKFIEEEYLRKEERLRTGCVYFTDICSVYLEKLQCVKCGKNILKENYKFIE